MLRLFAVACVALTLGACSFAKRVPLTEPDVGADQSITAPYEIELHSGVKIVADGIATVADTLVISIETGGPDVFQGEKDTTFVRVPWTDVKSLHGRKGSTGRTALSVTVTAAIFAGAIAALGLILLISSGYGGAP